MKKTYRNAGELESYLNQMVLDCETRLSDGQQFRTDALSYYHGTMSDLKARDGFSAAVSSDLRRSVKRVLPSIMRAFMTRDSMVNFSPVGEGDEDSAKQATDYVNHVIVPGSNAARALENSILDAMLLKTGILKWYAVASEEVKAYTYTDHPEEDAGGFVGQPDTEVLDFTPHGDGLCDFTVRKLEKTTDIRLEAIPRGSFLIHPATENIEDSPMVGERQRMSRSELISRGYSKEIINSLGKASTEVDPDRFWRSDQDVKNHSELTHSMEQVLVYELYVRIDLDEDGKAELWKFVFCSESSDNSDSPDSPGTILEAAQVNEAPYSRVVLENTPFMFEGRSLSEDVMPIQRIKTSLLRSALDNTYWSNNPLTFVNVDAVEDVNSLYKPRFGQPILLKSNAAAEDAFSVVTRPFIAQNSFEVMQHFDIELEQTTGATESSGGLDPEQVSGTSATAALVASEKGYQQVEMMVRVLGSGGIKDAFRGLLKLVIQHSDGEKRAKINDEWVSFDPRVWNVDMDCVVNVGLGAGSRTQDKRMLLDILQMQENLIGKMGINNPFVKPTQLFNTMEKLIECSGFASATPYLTKPEDEAVFQEARERQEAMSQGDGVAEAKITLEREKANNKNALDTQQAEFDQNLEMLKMEGNKIKEEAQMMADLQTQQQQADIDTNMAVLKGQLDLMKHREKLTLEYLKADQMPPLDLYEPDQPEGL